MAKAQVRVPGVEARAGKFPGPSLIPALNAIQERVGWLPREELVSLSREVHRPLYEIEGLISFYPHFRTEPPKGPIVQVCRAEACQARGAREVFETATATATEMALEIEEVFCLGLCTAGPTIAVDGELHCMVDPPKMVSLLKSAVEPKPVAAVATHHRVKQIA